MSFHRPAVYAVALTTVLGLVGCAAVLLAAAQPKAGMAMIYFPALAIATSLGGLALAAVTFAARPGLSRREAMLAFGLAVASLLPWLPFVLLTGG